MRLIIRRNYDRALLRGVSFSIDARVELTPVEEEAIAKYKAHSVPLKQGGPKGSAFAGGITIADILKGKSYKCKDLSQLVNSEVVIKEACASLRTHLNAMTSLSGEDEVIEY